MVACDERVVVLFESISLWLVSKRHYMVSGLGLK